MQEETPLLADQMRANKQSPAEGAKLDFTTKLAQRHVGGAAENEDGVVLWLD
jgi:hypothetical protein